MTTSDTIAALESLDRRASLAAAEIADERIDAERVSWLGVLLRDYERLYRMHEEDDPDPSATDEMLREMWGMHAGLVKAHGDWPTGETSETPDDAPL